MRPNVCLLLGAAWMWQKPDAEVIGAIRRAIELGINYALILIAGHAEAPLGRSTLRWIAGKGLFASEGQARIRKRSERLQIRFDLGTQVERHKQT